MLVRHRIKGGVVHREHFLWYDCYIIHVSSYVKRSATDELVQEETIVMHDVLTVIDSTE